jgi:molybdopterin-guanine dinucleotide biosynthesis protein A
VIQELEVFVIAGGEGTRFKSSTPKHLVEIAGEPLLSLLAKKLSRYTKDLKIIIPPDKESYKQVLGNQFQLLPRVGDVNAGTGKHIEAIKASSSSKNLLIIYGDCYISNKALDTIFQETILKKKSIVFFCRHNGYAFANKGGGEIFGVYIDRDYKKHFLEAAYKTQELYDSKRIWRDGTWEIAKTLKNHSLENEYREHPKFDFYFEINDLTDDIDFIEEYNNLRTLIPDTFEESIILLEKIYESLNNIAQKNEINLNSFITDALNNVSKSGKQELILSKIIELQFDDLKNKSISLEKQLLAVIQSKSYRYTLIFRKILHSIKLVKSFILNHKNIES